VPLGIMAALIIVTLFYLLVAVAALGAQPAAMFEGQEAGLAVNFAKCDGKNMAGFGAFSRCGDFCV